MCLRRGQFASLRICKTCLIVLVFLSLDCRGQRLQESLGLSHISRQARELKDGSSSKHLNCKLEGGCSQCQESEEIERYCADTGFKELLRCTTDNMHQGRWPVVLSYPYPSDVHLDEARETTANPADPTAAPTTTIRVVRGCTESTVAAHQAALAGEVAAAGGGSGLGFSGMGDRLVGHYTSLYKFELGVVLALGLALPVVYWRKTRIRHL